MTNREIKSINKNERYIVSPTEEEKLINRRIFGFVLGFFVMLLISLFWFVVDEDGMGIAFIVLAFFQIVFMLTTPKSYVFSEERLVINYFFGLKENIPWQNVRYVLKNHEKVTRYRYLGIFEVGYYFEEKRPFYMRGRVSKNKKTKELMKKYCPTGVR